MLQYNPDSEKTQTKPFLPESDLPAQHGGAGKGETMVKNSKSIALLVLMIVLLVLISSRMAPRQAQRPGVPTVTDLDGDGQGRIVTTADVDLTVKTMAKLLGEAVNSALHPGLSKAELDGFLM